MSSSATQSSAAAAVPPAVPSASMAAALKQLRIQTGVVRRLSKEVCMYKTEAAGLQADMERMQLNAASAGLSDEDECRLRKRQEVLRESQMMVPDTERRLLAAKEKLAQLVTQHEAECAGDSIFQLASAELLPPGQQGGDVPAAK